MGTSQISSTAEGIGRWPALLGATLDCLVSDVDADGNEVAGIRMPLVAVPLGTSAGWNPRLPVHGLPAVLLEFVGSFVPFARTEAERVEATDPRPSLAERYAGRGQFAALVLAACESLVEQRFLLPVDVAALVEQATEAYQRATNVSS